MPSSVLFLEKPADWTHGGVKTIYWLLGLSGAALVTSSLWPFSFWILALYFLFPFSSRVVALGVYSSLPFVPLLPLAICYGACELIIALGMRRTWNWSRKALFGLASLWIVYGILDTILLHEGFYGAPSYYYVDPIAVIYAIIGAILILYLRRKSVREYFNP